jgi:hypothetical protein
MNNPYLTMAEIEAKYPNEWVFITNATTNGASLAPTGGVVVFHSPDHIEFSRMRGDWNGWGDPTYRQTASWYTGYETVDALLPVEKEPGAA